MLRSDFTCAHRHRVNSTFSGSKEAQSLRTVPDYNTKNAGTAFFDGSYFDENHLKNNTFSSIKHIPPRWNHKFLAVLIVVDAAMANLATTIIFLLRPETYSIFIGEQTQQHRWVLSVILIATAWVVALFTTHAYQRHTMGEGYELYSKIIRAGLIDFVFLCASGYIFKVDLSRFLVVFVPLVSTTLTLVERWLFRRLLHYYRTIHRCNYATAIVGSPEGIRKTLKQLKQHRGLGYEPIAICPVLPDTKRVEILNNTDLLAVRFTPRTTEERSLRILTMNSHLPQTMKHLNIETVLVTDVIERHSEIMRTFSLAVESMGMELAFSSTFAYSTGSQLRLRENQEVPIVTASLPQYSQGTLIFKRCADIALSLLAIIISTPIMFAVACAVKFSDGGPLLFKQERIGLLGRPFTMLKFRSMRADAEEMKAELACTYGIENNVLFKLKDDPRVTKVGHFIRKMSLDEFPQFFNVLKGDMSFVGPRPPLPEEVKKYNTLYSSRLLVRPGITGLWQISGRSDISQEESERLDVSYVEQWSLSRDITILLKTVVAVIKSSGAY